MAFLNGPARRTYPDFESANPFPFRSPAWGTPGHPLGGLVVGQGTVLAKGLAAAADIELFGRARRRNSGTALRHRGKPAETLFLDSQRQSGWR